MFYQVYTTKVKRLKQVFLDRADGSVLLTFSELPLVTVSVPAREKS